MQIKLHCNTCEPDENRHLPFQWVVINDEGYYEYTCSCGHLNAAILTGQPFERLIGSACVAFKDGYYRECVFNLASALERFYEFCIKVILLELETWQFNSSRVLDDSWAWVKKQSERQLGAFLFLYLGYCKEAAPYKELNKKTGFRNKVIHQGHFPDNEEVVQYGNVVFAFIREVCKKLIPSIIQVKDFIQPTKLSEFFAQEQRDHLQKAEEKNLVICNISLPTLLQIDSRQEIAKQAPLDFLLFVEHYHELVSGIYGRPK